MAKKTVAIILSIIMVFSSTAITAFGAGSDAMADFENKASKFLARTLGAVVETLVGFVDKGLSENSSFVTEDEFVYSNFYEGTANFISQAKPGANWSLGQASVSLVPENFEDYDLYLGGFMSEQNLFTNDVREILDDMKVRVIALNDGSGRGTAVFATVDSIGVSGGDVRHIRGLLKEYAENNGINSINIFSTHTHSGIDTQGMWTEIFKKWPVNLVTSALKQPQYQLQGTDPEYMEFFYGKITEAIESAVSSMSEGKMTYAEKDIGEKYFNNKNRPTASSMDTKLRRFTFTPNNQDVKPTIILNMSAHPDVVGLATGEGANGHGVSGDYIYYIGETLNNAGYNFMFFNGAICGIYIGRISAKADQRVDIAANYGREIGKMTLALTMSEDEIKADEYLMSLNLTKEQTEGHYYTPWYNGWQPVTETEVDPILNIRLEKVEIKVTNPLIRAAGKINLVNHLIKKVNDGYTITTEIGYIEMGKNIKIAMVPGEFCTDLAYGGISLTKEGSVSGEAFENKTLTDIFGKDVIVFGLANDAVGYIVPDNDYAMSIAFGHYAETLSLGKNTASTIMDAFQKIAK